MDSTAPPGRVIRFQTKVELWLNALGAINRSHSILKVSIQFAIH